MRETTCFECGAVDPGRFCGKCGAEQTSLLAAAGRGGEQAPQATHPAHGHEVTGNGDPGQPPTQQGAGSRPSSHGAEHPALGAFDEAGPYPNGPARSRRSPAVAVAASLAALLAVTGGMWFVAGRHDGDLEAGPVPAPTVTVTASAPPQPAVTPTPGQPASAQARTSVPSAGRTNQSPAAVATPRAGTVGPSRDVSDDGPTDADNALAEDELGAIYQADIARYPRGPHAIVQLSAKHHGTSDPESLTARGTRTWQSVDILEEHRKLRGRYSQVLLVKGRDVNSTNLAAADDWITIRDASFRNESAAEAWCMKTLGPDSNRCYGSVTK